MQIAAIDIGTNTINLLVASPEAGGLKTIHSSKIGAKLGKGGISNGIISPEAISRGVDAIARHLKTLELFPVDKTFAFATSAVRNASNGTDFTNEIWNRFGLDVKTISGEEEARLIFEGVKPLLPNSSKSSLILDIGGGSCEFIIANSEEVVWSQSFELGMARLLDKFNPSEPMKEEEICLVNSYLDNQLGVFKQAVKLHKPQILVGASGSFDTLAAMYEKYFPKKGEFPVSSLNKLSDDVFDFFYNTIVPSTVTERMQMPGMDPVRVEFMVLAMLFIKFVISVSKPLEIFQSAYAIKEGIIFDYLKQPN